jgi:hypothetical protein
MSANTVAALVGVRERFKGFPVSVFHASECYQKKITFSSPLGALPLSAFCPPCSLVPWLLSTREAGKLAARPGVI